MKSFQCLLKTYSSCLSAPQGKFGPSAQCGYTFCGGVSWPQRNQAPIFIPKSSLHAAAHTVFPGGIPSHLERAAKIIFSSPHSKGLQGDCTKSTADVQAASLSHPRKPGCCSPSSLPMPICMGNQFLSISTHTRGRHLTQPGANSNLPCSHTGEEAEVPFRALVVSCICLFTARTQLLHNAIPADFPVLPFPQ